jgi:hypothetical protein
MDLNLPLNKEHSSRIPKVPYSQPFLLMVTILELMELLLPLQEECRTSENKTQTQVVGGKIYYASGPAPWISPKMEPAP